MKIPKIIKMFGYKWKVVLSDKSGNSSYDWSNFKITVCKKYAEEELVHEILEACLVHLHFRYAGIEGGMEYKFIFDHTGLCQAHKLLFQTLKENNLI